ncbi:jg10619 [Pararge aegeria aegeria]|uniref:Jg10619 protein n=1 Tax=Pararge aegeria aegeria TaxID=348720 RepID=A0A8S4R8Z5_9NEOP|nr:jg10619 [Pararge aegeria aegeria]
MLLCGRNMHGGSTSPSNIPSVDIVEDCIYLGSQICNDGSCVPEIKRRIAMAKSAMTRLGSIWKNRGITFNTKSRLVRALIFPIFMYGVETWTINAREMRMLRILWTAKRTNVSILAQLGVSVRLSSICYQRLLSYFGHIMRRGNASLEKIIVTGNTEGEKPRGRSPTRWADQLKKSNSDRFYQIAKMASNRSRWRQFTNAKLRSQQGHDLQS